MRPVTALFLGFIWSQFVATIWQSQRVSTNTPPRPLDSRTAPLYRPAMPTPDPAPESILIVDFGSQVTQLIARRVREAGVYSEIVPFSGAEAALERMQPKGVILSGSPASVPASGRPRAPPGSGDRRGGQRGGR